MKTTSYKTIETETVIYEEGKDVIAPLRMICPSKLMTWENFSYRSCEHLRLTVEEARQILADLTAVLKEIEEV